MTKEEKKVNKHWWRWLILLVVSLVMFGSYYIYDVLSPINEFIQQDMGIDNAKFGLLFSSYYIINLLFVLLIAGFILDRFGIRKAGTFYVFLILLGSLVTSLGAGKSFVVMLIGRMLFGVGSEATLLVTNKVIARWFKGKELGFAYGLNITVMRFGTVLAFNTSVQIANWTGAWRWSVWAGTVVMFVSFILFLVYLMIDKDVDKKIEAEIEEKIVIKDVLKMSSAFWFISILCVTFYSAIFPFTNHAPRFLQIKFGLSAAKGGQYTSYIMIASMIFTPLLGLLVDKFGHRGRIMIIGSLLLVPAHLLLGLTFVHPAVSFIILGISFSLVPAALWPAIPILVKEKFLGTAFGIVAWIQMSGLTLFPWLAGKIVDLSGDDYTNMEIMFAMLGFVGLIFSILLLRADKKQRLGLELPTKEAQARADNAS
ncbi:MAG: MFS transporter [Candidatus Aminicenantes bacterium]|nr:MFS transporter [Candidatus Aminicenantes bacterium]MDH5385699.1 MFS transporter [Candidatus Aminicenantes bacterium]MDH5743315.1 MFS transporter [Candidatus Aminicenantes bacterium]